MSDNQSNQNDNSQRPFNLDQSQDQPIPTDVNDRLESSQNSLFNQNQNNHQHGQQLLQGEEIDAGNQQQFDMQAEQPIEEQNQIYDQETQDTINQVDQNLRNQNLQLPAQQVPEALQHGHNNRGRRIGRNHELTIVQIYEMIVGNKPFFNLGQKLCTWLKFITRQLNLGSNFPGLQTFKWLSINDFAEFIQNSGFPKEVFQKDLFNLELINEFFQKKLNNARYLNRYPRDSPRYRFIKFLVQRYVQREKLEIFVKIEELSINLEIHKAVDSSEDCKNTAKDIILDHGGIFVEDLKQQEHETFNLNGSQAIQQRINSIQ